MTVDWGGAVGGEHADVELGAVAFVFVKTILREAFVIAHHHAVAVDLGDD